MKNWRTLIHVSHIPLQFLPSPWNPCLQRHRGPLAVSVQMAREQQPPLCTAHEPDTTINLSVKHTHTSSCFRLGLETWLSNRAYRHRRLCLRRGLQIYRSTNCSNSTRVIIVHCESKKGPLYFCPQLWQMLTDFRNFSIVEFIKKFATN